MATGLTKLIETVYGPLEQKRRWRRYKARAERLPENYRVAIEALQRYSNYSGLTDGESILAMLEDLIDLFEQAAANETPIRELVGQDPVEFMEEFLNNYKKRDWKTRERERLTAAIKLAAGENAGSEGTSR
jgi:DNA-binding ferritin-like protein (Dps family)